MTDAKTKGKAPKPSEKTFQIGKKKFAMQITERRLAKCIKIPYKSIRKR